MADRAITRAVLLCAGFGTRLRPLTDNTPKPLVKVAGRRIVDYLMDQLQTWPSLQHIAVVINDAQPEQWQAWASDWKPELDAAGIGLSLLNDGVTEPEQALGAVRDLHFALDQVGTDSPALVAAGDSIFRLWLDPLREAFERSGTPHALALYEDQPAHLRQTSILQFSEDGSVAGLLHGVTTDSPQWASPACYALTASALSHVTEYLDNEGDPDSLGAFLGYLAERETVRVARGPERSGMRVHINTPAAKAQAESVLRNAPVLLA